MSAITIRKLPQGVEQRLRERAASHGRSMEAEARIILIEAVEVSSSPARLSWIEMLVEAGEELGGVDLPVSEAEPATAAAVDSWPGGQSNQATHSLPG